MVDIEQSEVILDTTHKTAFSFYVVLQLLWVQNLHFNPHMKN